MIVILHEGNVIPTSYIEFIFYIFINFSVAGLTQLHTGAI